MGRITIAIFLISVFVVSGCATTNKRGDLSMLSDKEIEEYNNNPNNTDKIVCEEEKTIGSNIVRRVCRIKSDRDQETRESQRTLENLQRSGGTGGGS